VSERQGRDCRRGHAAQPRLQHAVLERPRQEADAGDRDRSEAANLTGLPADRSVLRLSRALHHADPGSRQPLRPARHVHAGRAGPEHRGRHEVGHGGVPPDLREAQEGMTPTSIQGGGPEPTARAAVVSVAAPARSRLTFQSQTSRRLAFGYLLLAPAVLYVLLLVGAPFLFSLYLAVSDANVGDPVATFIGLENFRAALEMDVFWTALQNSVIFLVVAAIFKSILGTSLAFLLLQEFPGKKLIRALVGIPFPLPIAISVLAWKWMYDSQFSVINWVLSRLGLIGQYGTDSWPIWLGDPKRALLACLAGKVGRTFPFSAIVLLAGFTSVPLEVLDAAKVDGCSFFQRFRHVVVPMIAPILLIGFLFDTVFTLSDLSVVYLLTQGGPGNATKILPVLAY